MAKTKQQKTWNHYRPGTTEKLLARCKGSRYDGPYAEFILSLIDADQDDATEMLWGFTATLFGIQEDLFQLSLEEREANDKAKSAAAGK